MRTSIPKRTTESTPGRVSSKAFTSGVTMEKRVLSKLPIRSGPMDTKSISGTMGPSASRRWKYEYRVSVKSGTQSACTFRILCGCNYFAAEYLIRDAQACSLRF